MTADMARLTPNRSPRGARRPSGRYRRRVTRPLCRAARAYIAGRLAAQSPAAFGALRGDSEAPGDVHAAGDGFAVRVDKYGADQCKHQQPLITGIHVVPGLVSQLQ
jgi:hypothetical protein